MLRPIHRIKKLLSKPRLKLEEIKNKDLQDLESAAGARAERRRLQSEEAILQPAAPGEAVAVKRAVWRQGVEWLGPWVELQWRGREHWIRVHKAGSIGERGGGEGATLPSRSRGRASGPRQTTCSRTSRS